MNQNEANRLAQEIVGRDWTPGVDTSLGDLARAIDGPAQERTTNNFPVELQPTLHQEVMVKFTVLRMAMVPPGIAYKGKVDPGKADEKHCEKAQKLGFGELAQFGRIRKDRGDTGFHAVDNIGPVQLAMLTSGLANHSYHLTDVWYQVKERHGANQQRTVYVVTLLYKFGEETVQLAKELRQDLLLLRRVTWRWCHVYDNPTVYNSVTVNLGGPMQGVSPKWAVVVRQRKLQVIPVEKPVEEAEE